MALSAKLMMRQGQSLVMTPQLLQAIKLLQFSSIELASFIEEELERNPMLERVEESGGELPISEAATPDGQGSDAQFSEPDEPRESDWAGEALATDGAALEASLGTELSNTFDADRPAVSPEASTTLTDAGLSATSWTGAVGPPSNGEAAKSRGLCRGQTDAARSSPRTACSRLRRSGRSDDRPHAH